MHLVLGSLDPCTLCGFLMHAGVERRYKQTQPLSDLFARCCLQTPFVYEHIMGVARADLPRWAAAPSLPLGNY